MSEEHILLLSRNLSGYFSNLLGLYLVKKNDRRTTVAVLVGSICEAASFVYVLCTICWCVFLTQVDPPQLETLNRVINVSRFGLNICPTQPDT